MPTRPRPLIGITSYVADARWGFWELPAALVPLGYVQAVTTAGGRPVVLPPVPGAAAETLTALDGLILCGGPDLDPAVYGQERLPASTPVAPQRDAAELALLHGALELDLPVLGICRGMQLINVAYGGDLVQHLPDVVGHDGHRTRAGAFDLHPIELAAASRAGAILGERADVHSGHHQGLATVGAGLEAVAWAEDGSVEAVEDPRSRFVVGVLWHPEEGSDGRLFEALVQASAANGSHPG